MTETLNEFKGLGSPASDASHTADAWNRGGSGSFSNPDDFKSLMDHIYPDPREIFVRANRCRQ